MMCLSALNDTQQAFAWRNFAFLMLLTSGSSFFIIYLQKMILPISVEDMPPCISSSLPFVFPSFTKSLELLRPTAPPQSNFNSFVDFANPRPRADSLMGGSSPAGVIHTWGRFLLMFELYNSSLSSFVLHCCVDPDISLTDAPCAYAFRIGPACTARFLVPLRRFALPELSEEGLYAALGVGATKRTAESVRNLQSQRYRKALLERLHMRWTSTFSTTGVVDIDRPLTDPNILDLVMPLTVRVAARVQGRNRKFSTFSVGSQDLAADLLSTDHYRCDVETFEDALVEVSCIHFYNRGSVVHKPSRVSCRYSVAATCL
jgi:hypothetical protein